MSRNVCDTLLEVLAEAGVTHIFGIPGDAINSLTESVRKQDRIQFVQVRHEEAGAFAASAQAKLTGRLTACVGTAGPGAIHLLNGLYDAKVDHAPVIAITGQVETSKIGNNSHQEINLHALFEDVSIYNQTVMNAAQMPRLAALACQNALDARTPAHLSLPVDIARAKTPNPDDRDAVVTRRSRIAPCDEDAERAAQILDKASAVAILAGIGAADAVDELTDLAEKLGAPIVKTLRAKDLLPDEHPLVAGGLGLLGTKSGVEAIERCDALLMVGTDFPYSDFLPESASVVQIDRNPVNLGRRVQVEAGVTASARLGLSALAQRVEAKGDRDFLESIQKAAREGFERRDKAERDLESNPIRPQAVARAVGELAADDAIFCCDTGAVTVWAARNLRIRERQRFTLSANLASMAYALPAAIGAQVAYPDRQVVALAGDGGFAMLMGDFLTAVKHELPITVVVFANDKFGLIQMEQEVQGYPEFVTHLHNCDFGAFARLCGGHGVRVSDPKDLRPALREALDSNKPAIVHVDVNPDERTMPPTIAMSQALGYGIAKIREVLGQGDQPGGIESLRSAFR